MIIIYTPFIIYFIIINLIGFITMGYDKIKARQNEWRISEKAIFTIALLLGSIGITCGMYVFRHKTKHLKFTFGIPLILVLNIITIYYIIKSLI